MKWPLILVSWVIALIVGAGAVYAVLSPQIEDEKKKVQQEQGKVKKAAAEADELEHRLESDATWINSYMQEMNEHIETAEEEIEADSLEGVEEHAKELAEYSEAVSKLTPPKNAEQVSQFRQLATEMKRDAEALEESAVAGDITQARTLVHKIQDGCVFCHPLFRQDNSEIHPENHHNEN